MRHITLIITAGFLVNAAPNAIAGMTIHYGFNDSDNNPVSGVTTAEEAITSFEDALISQFTTETFESFAGGPISNPFDITFAEVTFTEGSPKIEGAVSPGFPPFGLRRLDVSSLGANAHVTFDLNIPASAFGFHLLDHESVLPMTFLNNGTVVGTVSIPTTSPYTDNAIAFWGVTFDDGTLFDEVRFENNHGNDAVDMDNIRAGIAGINATVPVPGSVLLGLLGSSTLIAIRRRSE